MSQELSVKLMCILLRSGVEIWIEEERIESLKKILTASKESKFIELNNEVINTADVVGIFTPETMKTKEKIKQGQWQCEACKRWHPRGEQCGCAGGKY